MNVIVCACGRRVESDGPLNDSFVYLSEVLHRGDHDPDECSRQVGFQGRFDGRTEMVEATMQHLASRRSLGADELVEIRRHLTFLASSMPLGRRS